MSTIGVLGGRWRATVSGAGSIAPWDGSACLGWYVAADDRWHSPESEPTVRQRRIEGTPVLETRLKVPRGDAVQRVWCVADGGGYTVIEVENDSPLPFAVAFDRAVLSQRPPTDVPIHGLDLPTGSVVFPVGHRAAIRVALAHGSHEHDGASALDRLPSAQQVARGWTTILDRAGRLVLPDSGLVDDISRWRSELALCGPADSSSDAAGFLIDVAQIVRMGEQAEPWVPDVADAVAAVARCDSSRDDLAWDQNAALDAAAIVLACAGETRALADVARLRRRGGAQPLTAPVRRELVWNETRLARRTGEGGAELLGLGIPSEWLGVNFEVHGLPTGPATTVSFALRWHGERPAVLWELDGPIVPMTAPSTAPGWSTAEASGEVLWPPPAAFTASSPAAGPDVSFS